VFNEVHGDRVPWLGGYRKLFEKAIRFMSRRLGPLAYGASIAVRTEANDKVELTKVLCPTCLAAVKDLGSRKYSKFL